MKRIWLSLCVWSLCVSSPLMAGSPFSDDVVSIRRPINSGATTQSAPKKTAQPTAAVLGPQGSPQASTSSQTATSDVPIFTFNAEAFPGFYDASQDADRVYNIPRILRDVPNMWATYGPLFKAVGKELGVDPYALAAYCVFESYDVRRGNYNPRMRHVAGGMYAAGIAATQAQIVKGRQIPGLDQKFPPTTEETAEVLRNNPEYGIRWLAAFFKKQYEAFGQDLAKAFPRVAYPAWNDPNQRKGAYGTQAVYVSRAYVLYRAFAEADRSQ